MNKKILLLFGCSHLGQFAKYRLGVEFKFVELDSTNKYYFLSFADKEKVKKYLMPKTIEVIDGQSYFSSQSWFDSYKILDSLQSQYGFEKIIMVFSPLIERNSLGNERRLVESFEVSLKNDKFMSSFFSIFQYYKRVFIAPHYMHQHNIPLVHFIDDLLEPNYKKLGFGSAEAFHFYNLSRSQAKHFPFMEYGFVYKRPRIEREVKTNDFVFGMTSRMSSVPYRTEMISKLLALEYKFKREDLKYKMFFLDKKLKINTYCKGEEYNDIYIKSARYTLVIPPYGMSGFSYARFIEAIDRSCIPLIHKDCDYEECFTDKKEFLEIITSYDLFVDEFSLIDKIKELPYSDIINKLKTSHDYQQLLDSNYYRDYYEKYKEVIF